MDTARPTSQRNHNTSPALAALCPKDAVTLVTLTRFLVTKTDFSALVSRGSRRFSGFSFVTFVFFVASVFVIFVASRFADVRAR